MRQRILESLAPQYPRMLVFTNAEVRSWVLQLTDQWLQLTYSQVFIAVIVAILGIVNTLTVSIIDRKRELGVLRAVGGFRRQIRQTVWMEAVAIGLVGLALGLAVRRGQSVFPAADYGTRSVGDVSALPVPFQHRGRCCFRRFLRRHFSRRSGPPSLPFARRSSRRWNMNDRLPGDRSRIVDRRRRA